MARALGFKRQDPGRRDSFHKPVLGDHCRIDSPKRFGSIFKTFWENILASLRSLASDLGLSITTVSRALDGYEDVAATTRERVNKAAAAAGYRPN